MDSTDSATLAEFLPSPSQLGPAGQRTANSSELQPNPAKANPPASNPSRDRRPTQRGNPEPRTQRGTHSTTELRNSREPRLERSVVAWGPAQPSTQVNGGAPDDQERSDHGLVLSPVKSTALLVKSGQVQAAGSNRGRGPSNAASKPRKPRARPTPRPQLTHSAACPANCKPSQRLTQ